MKEMLSNILSIALGRSVLKGQYYFFKKIFVTLLLIIQPPMSYFYVKISQLVASLKTSRQLVVFARLVTSCQQVWNNLLTSLLKLSDLLQSCSNMSDTVVI